jgi:hypothetical protein
MSEDWDLLLDASELFNEAKELLVEARRALISGAVSTKNTDLVNRIDFFLEKY